MTKTQLEEAIRKIAREEVRSMLPTLLAEMALTASSSKKKTISESVVPTSAPKSKPMVASRPTNRPEIKFSNNPILNQILKETQGGIPVDDRDPVSMSMLNESIGTDSDIPLETFAKQDPTGVIIKDYSALLKKVNKIAASSRPL